MNCLVRLMLGPLPAAQTAAAPTLADPAWCTASTKGLRGLASVRTWYGFRFFKKFGRWFEHIGGEKVQPKKWKTKIQIQIFPFSFLLLLCIKIVFITIFPLLRRDSCFPFFSSTITSIFFFTVSIEKDCCDKRPTPGWTDSWGDAKTWSVDTIFYLSHLISFFHHKHIDKLSKKLLYW